MTLPRSSPRAQEVDAAGLIDFLDSVEHNGLELHSLMVARRGHVVAEGWWQPYAAGRAQLVYSVSKSLTSTAVGFLVQEGAVALDDTVIGRLGAAGLDDLHPHWARVTVRDCLTMTVGHDEDAWDRAFRGSGDVRAPGTDWLPIVLATTPEHGPGTTFTYNQVATYLLSRVVRAVCGHGVVEVLRPRLLDPLGISELLWQRDPMGHELGFTGAHLTTEGLLAFSQFCLEGGTWDGRRLLGPEWFAEASAPLGPPNRDAGGRPDSSLGYGYSFWMSRQGYRAEGAFGQLGIVLPEQAAVVAITAEHPEIQEILDAFWQTVLPAIGRTGSGTADAELAARLAHLALPTVSATGRGPDIARFRRAHNGNERALDPAYTGVSVRRDQRDPRGQSLDLVRGDDVLEIAVGAGEWRETVLEATGAQLPVLACGGWLDAERFACDVVVAETPHRFRVEASAGEASLTWRERPLPGADPFDLAVRNTSDM